MLNRVLLSGRMGKDPELRHTNSGTAVASFPLAVDRDFKDKSGERATDWFDIVVWRSSAEYVSRYGAKGRTVIVDGKLQMRDWTDKDGNKRRTVEVVAESVYFCDRREDAQQTAPQYSTPASGFDELPGNSCDLPF